MSKEKELAKNTFIIFLGTFCTKLITFLLLPLYTGILSTEEYGIYNLILAITTLLIPIITFQIEQAVFRYLINVRSDTDSIKRIVSSAFFSLILQCIIFLLIYTIIYNYIAVDYKIFLIFSVITNIFSSFFLQIARGLGENIKYSVGSFISAFVTILFNILFLLIIKLRVDGMLYALIIGQILCISYLFIYLKLYLYISIKKFDFKIVKKLWKYSMPLVPNSLSWWVFSSSDRIIVSSLLGLSFNGILSAASKFSEAFIILYNIFDRSWIESISLHINDDDLEHYFNDIFNKMFMFFSSLTIIMISSMFLVYNLMIDKKFFDGYWLVPFLLLSSLVNVLQGMAVVIHAAKNDTKSIAKTSIAAAIINIIFHLGFIKYIGIYAAVLSTVVSYLVIAIYRIYDVRKKYLKIKLNPRNVLYISIILSIALLVYYFNNKFCNIIMLFISIIITIIINRKIIKLILNKLLNMKGNYKYE